MNEQTPTTWIPVTERLPEPWVLVLICYAKDQISIAARIEGSECNFRLVDGSCGYLPTHWQPLPPPPPKPDAFETWWISQDGAGTNTTRIRSEQGESCLVYDSVARMIWDAAIASTNQ